MPQQYSEEERNMSGGIGFFGMLALVFITLKLTDVVDWSWWIVLAPLWGPFAFSLVLLVCILLFVTVTGGHLKVTRTKRPIDRPNV